MKTTSPVLDGFAKSFRGFTTTLTKRAILVELVDDAGRQVWFAKLDLATRTFARDEVSSPEAAKRYAYAIQHGREAIYRASYKA